MKSDFDSKLVRVIGVVLLGLILYSVITVNNENSVTDSEFDSQSEESIYNVLNTESSGNDTENATPDNYNETENSESQGMFSDGQSTIGIISGDGDSSSDEYETDIMENTIEEQEQNSNSNTKQEDQSDVIQVPSPDDADSKSDIPSDNSASGTIELPIIPIE